ncbi:MAG: cupin domain-containing protein [Betaproteobacteria bacterium]
MQAADNPPESESNSTRYAGPLALGHAMSRLALADEGAAFTRDGPRADVEYRDLGWSAATDGRIGAKHIRAIAPFTAETGWHWHDMHAHFVIVLRGWITFRYAGVDDEVTVRAGASLSQPAGVPHNVIARSDDMELIEINVPADFATVDLAASAATR